MYMNAYSTYNYFTLYLWSQVPWRSNMKPTDEINRLPPEIGTFRLESRWTGQRVHKGTNWVIRCTQCQASRIVNTGTWNAAYKGTATLRCRCQAAGNPDITENPEYTPGRRRSAVTLFHQNKRQTIPQWAEETGIPATSIYNRERRRTVESDEWVIFGKDRHHPALDPSYNRPSAEVARVVEAVKKEVAEVLQVMTSELATRVIDQTILPALNAFYARRTRHLAEDQKIPDGMLPSNEGDSWYDPGPHKDDNVSLTKWCGVKHTYRTYRMQFGDEAAEAFYMDGRLLQSAPSYPSLDDDPAALDAPGATIDAPPTTTLAAALAATLTPTPTLEAPSATPTPTATPTLEATPDEDLPTVCADGTPIFHATFTDQPPDPNAPRLTPPGVALTSAQSAALQEEVDRMTREFVDNHKKGINPSALPVVRFDIEYTSAATPGEPVNLMAIPAHRHRLHRDIDPGQMFRHPLPPTFQAQEDTTPLNEEEEQALAGLPWFTQYTQRPSAHIQGGLCRTQFERYIAYDRATESKRMGKNIIFTGPSRYRTDIWAAARAEGTFSWVINHRLLNEVTNLSLCLYWAEVLPVRNDGSGRKFLEPAHRAALLEQCERWEAFIKANLAAGPYTRSMMNDIKGIVEIGPEFED